MIKHNEKYTVGLVLKLQDKLDLSPKDAREFLNWWFKYGRTEHVFHEKEIEEEEEIEAKKLDVSF